MEFVNAVVKYFSDNILLSTLFAIIFFMLGSIFSSFFEPIGKKLYSFLIPPKVSIKIDFEKSGLSWPSTKTIQSSGIFSFPIDVPTTIHSYNYYMKITNTSEMPLNNINLKIEYDIDYIINDEDNEYIDENFKKEIYIDHLQVGQTVEHKICDEQSLTEDTDIKIFINSKECKKNIIQNKTIRKELKRIFKLGKN